MDMGYQCSDASEASFEMYYFNVDQKMCEPFEYLGCGGNGNQFETFEACDWYCSFQGDKRPFASVDDKNKKDL